MDHNEYLKIRRRVAEELFYKCSAGISEKTVSEVSEWCISMAESFATKLRLSEAKYLDLDGVYKDFDHLPPMWEGDAPVDEEELLNYMNNIPQSDDTE